MKDADKIKALSELLRDTWMMLWHAANIDFSNGNVHNGMDEGDVRGWEYYHDLENKLFELLGEEYLGTVKRGNK